MLTYPRRPVAPVALAAFVATSALLLLGPPGCDEQGDPGARRVTLQTRVSAGGEGGAPFTNALGWSITLSRAQVSLGALYYFDGEPVLSRLAPPRSSPAPRWALPFGERKAYAHPGHYVPGSALGQMLQPSVFDLSAGDAPLPPGDGVTGPFRSAKVVFGAPEGGAAAVSVVGKATKGADTRAFSADFSADELRADETETESAVEGCAFDPIEVQGDGTVTFVVRPSIWFEQTDFAELAPPDDASPSPLPADGSARRALARGIKKGAAYGFNFSSQLRIFNDFAPTTRAPRPSMRPPRPLFRLAALPLALALAACGGGDDAGGGAPGTVAFTTYGEDYIEQQIPAEDVEDGWAITYDKFLIVLGGVRVATAGGEVGGEMASSMLFNMKAPGEKPVASFEMPSRTYDAVSYRVGPLDASTQLAPGTTEADRALLAGPNASVYVSGSAAKAGVTKTFKWLFAKPTALENCEGEKDAREVLGAVVTAGNVDQIQLTIHGDHLFYDDLQSPEAKLRFDAMAAADKNNDNDVTLDELRAVKLADIAVGTYGTGSADINDLGAFVEALSQTLGHFRGEGECRSRSL